MKLNTPNSGERILPWAREATREINANRPTAGNGITITKTNNGTTFSLDKKSAVYPDSAPPVIAGQLSAEEGEELPEGAFATTYSIEKNQQNAFSLFGFSNLSNQISSLNYKDLSLRKKYDMILRAKGDAEGTILSSPTVVYAPLSNLKDVPDSEIEEPKTYSIQHDISSENELELFKFHDWEHVRNDYDSEATPKDFQVLIREREKLDGQDDTALSLNYVTKDFLQDALSVIPDSELPEQRIVSRSIQHNSENGLEIYHFEELQDGDIIPAALTSADMAGKLILIRGTSTVEETGATVPTVRYMYLSAFKNLDEVEDENLICAWDDENEQLQVYVGDQLKVCYANSHLVTQLAASTITTGWNSVSRATEIWLNVYCEAVNNLVNYANFSSYKWDISNASNDKAAAGLMPVFSILIAKFEGGKVIQYRRGTVEFGQVVPDSKVPNKWKSLEYYDLGLTEDGIQIYQFNNGINKSTSEDMWKLFDNRYHRSDWGFMIRDSHNGLGDQDEVYYLNAQALVAMCVADCVIPNPLMYSLQSSNIGQGMGDDDVGSVGESLYRFANCSNLRFTRNGEGVITKRECDYTYPMDSISQSTSAYMDIVIRKHHEIGENGLPTVGYIPLSSIFPLSGGGGGSDPVLDSDTGAIGNSIEWNYDSEIQIYHFQDSTGRVGRSDLIANNPDIILRWWNNGIPEVRYTRFNTLSSAIEDAIAPTAGFTGTLSTVCDVRYDQNSHAFEKKFRIDTYENGRLITAVENNNWDNVFTAVPELL